jgi:hypothetical protein
MVCHDVACDNQPDGEPTHRSVAARPHVQAPDLRFRSRSPATHRVVRQNPGLLPEHSLFFWRRIWNTEQRLLDFAPALPASDFSGYIERSHVGDTFAYRRE